jgi:hypothetical protein
MATPLLPAPAVRDPSSGAPVPFSRDDTLVVKGFAILMIVLHNFLHTIPPVIGENQFAFSPDITRTFGATMASSATEWPRALLSYLGHYGVQLFVFFSAYGLALRHGAQPPAYGSFLRDRAAKIYLPFAGVVLLYVLLWQLRSLVLLDPDPLAWRSLGLKLLLVSNLVPGEARRPVGPWWFLPFIAQWYLVYPLLSRMTGRHGVAVLAWTAMAALIVEWAFNPSLMRAGLNLNFMVIGHLPVLCLGMYAAHVTTRTGGGPLTWTGRRTPLAVLTAALVFAVANVDATAWLAGDVAATVLLLAVMSPLVRARTGRKRFAAPIAGGVRRLLCFYGTIALPLFLVNGFLRSPFADPAIERGLWWFTLLCAVMSLAFSTVVAFGLHTLEARVRDLPRGRSVVREAAI